MCWCAVETWNTYCMVFAKRSRLPRIGLFFERMHILHCGYTMYTFKWKLVFICCSPFGFLSVFHWIQSLACMVPKWLLRSSQLHMYLQCWGQRNLQLNIPFSCKCNKDKQAIVSNIINITSIYLTKILILRSVRRKKSFIWTCYVCQLDEMVGETDNATQWEKAEGRGIKIMPQYCINLQYSEYQIKP